MPKREIQTLLDSLQKGLYERDEIIQLALLGAVAGESIFMLGPPGVAKSLIARRLKHAFKDGKSFEYLMNRFSTPDEIFGPVSIQKLKQDKYERQTAAYLPGATVVFLDEIWKAGPSIQNTLLTVLNEKVYRNGAQEEKLPLRCVISASNELPAEGKGLEALWDRFLIRSMVEGIVDHLAFEQMITGHGKLIVPGIEASEQLDEKTLKLWTIAIGKVKVPDEVLKTIHIVRGLIQKYNEKNPESKPIYVSDRRWKKIIHLLRTSAFLNDRASVDLMDCLLIPHCIWDEPEQMKYLKKAVEEAVEKHGYSLGLELGSLKKAIGKLEAEVEGEIHVKVGESFSGSVLSPIRGSSLRNRAKNSADQKTQILHKTPNPRLAKIWDSRILEIDKIIQQKEAMVQQYQNIELKASRNNLFVPEEKFQLVTASLQTTMERLKDLRVDLKRLQQKYQNVEDGKVEEI